MKESYHAIYTMNSVENGLIYYNKIRCV